MRIKTLIMLFFLMLASNILSAQLSQKIDLKLENATLKEFFTAIENKTEYTFMYKNQNLTAPISIEVKNTEVKEILNQLFRKLNIGYEVSGKRIILKDLVPQKTQEEKKQISGTVIDVQGEPIIGANVVEKGTTNGVITDMDGKFSLQITEKTILQISYIGCVAQEISVKNQNNITITLLEDFQALDEVVVVGYGTQKKVNLTGAVSSISTKDLTVAPVANTTNALAGRLPGLIVIQNSGQPGSDGATLNIRGFNNLSKDGDGPLIIVDGVEAPFRTIDPNMIESISVLKDGSAAIYGSRAGNGVILVTTKRGIQQKPTFTFNSNLTMQGVTSMPKPTSAGQYAELEREKWIQSGRPAEQAPFKMQGSAVCG